MSQDYYIKSTANKWAVHLSYPSTSAVGLFLNQDRGSYSSTCHANSPVIRNPTSLSLAAEQSFSWPNFMLNHSSVYSKKWLWVSHRWLAGGFTPVHSSRKKYLHSYTLSGNAQCGYTGGQSKNNHTSSDFTQSRSWPNGLFMICWMWPLFIPQMRKHLISVLSVQIPSVGWTLRFWALGCRLLCSLPGY